MTIDRRTMLAGAGGTAAAAMLGATPAEGAQVGAIGLQLYTLREVFAADPVGTLEKVARIGYREVEFGGGGYESMDHAMLRGAMDRLKLNAPSIHLSYPMLRDRFDATVAMARTLGAATLIVPYLDKEQRTGDGFDAVLSDLDRFAARLRPAGFALAYHNHDFEFTERSRGVSLFDRLLAETDPALVKIELDLFWAVHAGQDVPGLVRRLGSRLYAFHVKDMKPDRTMTAVGAGAIDFASIFRLPGASRVRHFYVENDQAPAPYFPDVATSFRNLRALRF